MVEGINIVKNIYFIDTYLSLRQINIPLEGLFMQEKINL